MSDFRTLGAMYVFMLIPVWIPLFAVASGRIYDAFAAAKSLRPVRAHRASQPQPLSVVQTGDPS